MTARKATIVIVDDHSLVRRGLTALIDNEPDLAVCGAAATPADGLQAIKQNAPDLAIVDLSIENSDDGLELVKKIAARYPKLPVLVLSMHSEAVYAERALRAGARGYLTKQQLDETVLVAIRRMLGGKLYMSDALAARLATLLVEGRAADTDSPLAALTDRELQVFRLLGEGRSTREIAQTLNLSAKTVESYREQLKRKLQCQSSPELIRRATRWIDTGQVG